ncbi:MAG: nucleotidyltransferase domain-containing protein [Bacteroidales bacterium]|nr:nucleotidyltransferase domain-containing protein [Bacteroidales bacterium]MBP5679710.1 nucleotidyltransferase domain-containing protein [Bacteroidales bacterium]
MTKQQIYQTIANYFKSQPIKKAWIFGSFARGEETPLSDIDVLVVYDDNARVSLLKQASMINELESLLNRSVDIVQEKLLQNKVRNSVNQDRKLIYERAN